MSTIVSIQSSFCPVHCVIPYANLLSHGQDVFIMSEMMISKIRKNAGLNCLNDEKKNVVSESCFIIHRYDSSLSDLDIDWHKTRDGSKYVFILSLPWLPFIVSSARSVVFAASKMAITLNMWTSIVYSAADSNGFTIWAESVFSRVRLVTVYHCSIITSLWFKSVNMYFVCTALDYLNVGSTHVSVHFLCNWK